MKNKSLAPIEKVLQNPFMPPFEKQEDDLKYGKIKIPVTSPDIQKIFEVRYNDIDVNLHANNGNYIIWAFEPLSFDFKIKHAIKTVEKKKKKEIKFSEELQSLVYLTSETSTVHVLKNTKTGEDICLLSCEWSQV